MTTHEICLFAGNPGEGVQVSTVWAGFHAGEVVARMDAEPQALLVPQESLHWDGDCQVVFVRDKNYFEPGAPKVFHVRSVRSGVKTGGNVEILAGLVPGEIVATKNSANLRGELLKNNLGAG